MSGRFANGRDECTTFLTDSDQRMAELRAAFVRDSLGQPIKVFELNPHIYKAFDWRIRLKIVIHTDKVFLYWHYSVSLPRRSSMNGSK